MQVTNDQNLIDTIARYYVERGALSIGDFALVGGGRSDFYIDGRLITTHTTALKQIAQVFSHHIREKVLLGPHDTLIAPVLSGIPVAVATALELNVDYVMDRGVAKEHGIGRRFEGAFNDGARCLIVDDLITVGSTVVNTIKELVADGREITDVIVIVNRQEGGEEALRDLGVELHWLVTKNDLISALQGDDDAK